MIGVIALKTAVIMGSDSDWTVMKSAVDILKQFDINVEVTVASAHRTPHKVRQFVEQSDANVFIAGAGMAAHLAGVVASYTTAPVIGVPINSEPFKGLDSLLATVQMPSGIPVATMAVNGAKNAALFAIEILAVNNQTLKQKLIDHRKQLADEVERKNQSLQSKL